MQKVFEMLDLNQLLTQVVGWLPALAVAVLILAAFWAAFRMTRKPLRGILVTTGLEEALADMLVNVYRVTLLAFGGVMAASQLGIDVGAALAGLGVVGLTIGFAAKDSLSNTIAGFLIFWDRPFTVGDWITVAGEYGRVTRITMRTTRIRTLNNTYVVIPNQTMIDEVLINHSKHGEIRVDVPVGIAYKESIEDARRVLLEAVKGIDGVAEDPAPDIVVSGLGDSSVDLSVRVWIGDAAKERAVHFRVVEASKLALDEAGIEIPFPHLQFFLENVSEGVWEKAGKKLLAAGKDADLAAEASAT